MIRPPPRSRRTDTLFPSPTRFRSPTHAASKPVAMIPNCAATRHAHFVLDGSGPAYLEQPNLAEWPDVNWTPDKARSEEHTSEHQSLMRISYAVFCLKKKMKCLKLA